MDMILEGLYIGNYRSARDIELLRRNNITHIVKLLLYGRPITTNHHYLCIRVSDTIRTNLAQYFSFCNDFIQDARLRNGNVLVHCYMGVSRSATVVLAYIMTVTDLGFRDAYRVVRSLHRIANPNPHFQRQLQYFELNQLMLERYRLRKRFPDSDLHIADRLRCRALLNDYELYLLERLRFNVDNHEHRHHNNENGRKEVIEDVSASEANLSNEQQIVLRQVVDRAFRERRHLIRPSADLNMDGFRKTTLMTGAVLYLVIES